MQILRKDRQNYKTVSIQSPITPDKLTEMCCLPPFPSCFPCGHAAEAGHWKTHGKQEGKEGRQHISVTSARSFLAAVKTCVGFLRQAFCESIGVSQFRLNAMEIK